ncbi:MAG TPA: ABC transporter ATP-binding protein [Pseudomonadales bacterium]|jgi:putative ABC transport system ATP-binding protein|nr:ABC transporter ATP-binding protein [Pseudomonadales bacterium]HNV54217.1 ABC transporter ATP-binding protein [Pseudomonadales bacterium]HQN41943.1 ABC transporter ATP-binding protein [Pseudomonadales bacterium]
MTGKLILEARQLSRSVTLPGATLTILDGVDLQVEQGQSLAIIGASGSGKSTLLGLLAGLDEPTQGTVWLDGVEITALDEEARARLRAQRVGFVFQSFQLLHGLTALENVMLPAELNGLADPRQQALEWLTRVGLAGRINHYPRQLSGGEQQRVAIARAFASRPKLLFADEPTGNLDTVTAGAVIDLLFELNRSAGTTLILVTHDHALAERCDRRIELRAGAVVNH